ncbi:SRPBCC domain-containing protein [Flavobacterium dauae]|uniref:SRPBCC domain-containing protein n=1 Tax=Flavobacterium dauae TaxID=1563479 RepID=UPI00101B34F4|nr:SRPBCC domain-containing protein [Flavobacterium dauae]WLD22696.1 SRPBCC domain-containing protein [Flavobacterium dauae]WLD24759.1 SRPBCC domain-containing protein [Flavobacterium dauae]
MEQKTKINAEDGKQDLVITRTFDLPLELLFKAYVEPELVEQWMGTKVLKLENKNHGSYQFETSHNGSVMFKANGTIHSFLPNERIVRTFEMENMPIGVQLEFLEFEKLSDEKSKLSIHIIYKSEQHRAEQLKMPFASGLNMAHNKLQEIVNKLK